MFLGGDAVSKTAWAGSIPVAPVRDGLAVLNNEKGDDVNGGIKARINRNGIESNVRNGQRCGQNQNQARCRCIRRDNRTQGGSTRSKGGD
ncbi:hypothetical protein CHCC14819_1794 [Bacillus licheniformis]|nr:hypothetical protein CHCC14819_1794 [Bacillus licheniformis]